jgi:hypothetical protein
MATAIRRTEAELKALMPNQVIPPIGSDTVEPTWQQIQLCSTLCAANAAAIVVSLYLARFLHYASHQFHQGYSDLLRRNLRIFSTINLSVPVLSDLRVP